MTLIAQDDIADLKLRDKETLLIQLPKPALPRDLTSRSEAATLEQPAFELYHKCFISTPDWTFSEAVLRPNGILPWPSNGKLPAHAIHYQDRLKEKRRVVNSVSAALTL